MRSSLPARSAPDCVTLPSSAKLSVAVWLAFNTEGGVGSGQIAASSWIVSSPFDQERS